MKKSILFTIDSLHCAGAEKSLVTLLSLLDYTKYEVDLQLLGYGGELEQLLPKEVNLLPPLPYTQFAALPIKKAIIRSIQKGDFAQILARIKYSRSIRVMDTDNAKRAMLLWKHTHKVIQQNPKHYDIAISYAQGFPTFYVAEKISADKKFAWVNVSYRLRGENKDFQKNYYNKYDKIVAVSESTKNIFLEEVPEYAGRMEVIQDINDYEFIKQMAEVGVSYTDQFEGIRILTIGRLAAQKGYDIALEACKKLKESGICFRWYVLGKGPLEPDIRKYIIENNLVDEFILLGVKANPYPYIKECDIYVQTSKFEGFGIAIAEARMLDKPVVTTRFDAVFTQMIHGKNGLVVDMNAEGIYQAIIELIENKSIKEEIVSYLKTEKKGNREELEKFYKLIG